jgi:hypothetical protein
MIVKLKQHLRHGNTNYSLSALFSIAILKLFVGFRHLEEHPNYEFPCFVNDIAIPYQKVKRC